MEEVQAQETVQLSKPEPARSELVRLLFNRHSVRSFQDQSLTLDQVSLLLFAAQGVNRPREYRTVPSAGALYPLEIFLVAGNVQTLEPGVYRFRPRDHALVRTRQGDMRKEVGQASLRQMWVAQAPAIFIISSVHDRVTGKYGRRGVQYAHIEAGCATQSVALQAVAQGLGTTVVGAFQEKPLKEICGSDLDEQPLIVLPVGVPRE